MLQFDKTQLMICRRCGATLSMDSQRTTILIGGFVALLCLPETNLLPFDLGHFWFIAILLLYTPFYIGYMKLNVVSQVDLVMTPNQEKEFLSYAKGRRHLNIAGHTLLWGGLLLFLAGMSISSMQVSEIVMVSGLVSTIFGFGMLAVTRCPFCKTFTIRNPFDNGGSCINCHRNIDISR